MNAVAKAERPKRKARRKPETVKVGNIAVKIYRRDKRHKVKDDAGNVIRKDVYRIWEVEDYTTGARRLQSFSDHQEAIDKANAIARQLSTGDATAAQMRNAEAASYGRAAELLRHTGASLELAASVYAKCFEILGGDRMIEAAQYLKRNDPDQLTHKTVAQTVDELVKLKEARKQSDRYVKDLKNRLERFAGDFAVDIHTVTTADVQRWLDRLESAPQTVKNFRTVIGTLFSYAESRGYIFKGSNPVESVESIKANGGAIEIYTPEEIIKLLNSASEDFRPVVALGAFAGLRSAEIARLEWKDIDVAGGFVHVAEHKAKTRSRRLVPI
ncbi:MAG TPA: hypothetical protein VHI52_10890, partial [Verrucomicrobiae bacterium]|nr:hypothetical protein [Verrucomicrobiae bacterium]